MWKINRNIVIRFIGSMVLSVNAVSVMAEDISARWCNGKVNNLLVFADGMVDIHPTFRGDWIAVCNVTNEWNGVSPSVCKSWLAQLITARQSGAEVMVQYLSAADCSVLPTYANAPKPNYIGLIGAR